MVYVFVLGIWFLCVCRLKNVRLPTQYSSIVACRFDFHGFISDGIFHSQKFKGCLPSFLSRDPSQCHNYGCSQESNIRYPDSFPVTTCGRRKQRFVLLLSFFFVLLLLLYYFVLLLPFSSLSFFSFSNFSSLIWVRVLIYSL